MKWDEGQTTKARHVDLQPINVVNDQPDVNADEICEPGLDQYVTTDAEPLTDEVIHMPFYFLVWL